jgi:hypothetical protein
MGSPFEQPAHPKWCYGLISETVLQIVGLRTPPTVPKALEEIKGQHRQTRFHGEHEGVEDEMNHAASDAISARPESVVHRSEFTWLKLRNASADSASDASRVS